MRHRETRLLYGVYQVQYAYYMHYVVYYNQVGHYTQRVHLSGVMSVWSTFMQQITKRRIGCRDVVGLQVPRCVWLRTLR